MSDFLVRRFIKDYSDTKNEQVREKYGTLASAVGLVCNLLLFAVKLATGFLLCSISVTSDAFNNLSDAASSVVSLVGVRLSARPADREHPYGHERMEYIAALVVSFLVLEVGWSFLKSAVEKIRTPEELKFSAASLILLLLSIGVKLWLSSFNRSLGHRIDSKVMEAAAADSAGDVLATAATVFSLLLYRFAGINIDGWIGIAVALVIIRAGIGILRETVDPLIGVRSTKEELQKLTSFVESFEGILGTHDLLLHHYGPTRCMASIHVEMDDRSTMEEVHRVIDRIEREAQAEFGISLVIHVDPVDNLDQDVIRHRSLVREVLKESAPGLHAHDFHMVRENGTDYLSFDLAVPYEMKENEAKELADSLRKRICEKDPDAKCIIDIDRE